MSKKRNEPQPFGSRKGIATPIVRSGSVSMKNDNRAWFNDLSRMLDEAKVMPTAAAIVHAYYREHGDKIADKPALNESMAMLNTVISSHLDAVNDHRRQLADLKESTGSNTKLSTTLTMSMLNIAAGIEDIMNDFSNVGMYAIDNCLEPYRVLAKENADVPSPPYMCPKPGQPAARDLIADVPVQEITVVGSKDELPVAVDPTPPTVH